jgi:hypothetical protein
VTIDDFMGSQPQLATEEYLLEITKGFDHEQENSLTACGVSEDREEILRKSMQKAFEGGETKSETVALFLQSENLTAHERIIGMYHLGVIISKMEMQKNLFGMMFGPQKDSDDDKEDY